jgi:hypothetical protein
LSPTEDMLLATWATKLHCVRIITGLIISWMAEQDLTFHISVELKLPNVQVRNSHAHLTHYDLIIVRKYFI